MISGHSMNIGVRETYANASHTSVRAAFVQAYNQHINGKRGYFPSKALKIKNGELEKIEEIDPEYAKQIKQAIKSLDALVQQIDGNENNKKDKE